MVEVVKKHLAWTAMAVALCLWGAAILVNQRYIDKQIEDKFEELSNTHGRYVQDKGPERIEFVEQRLEKLEGGQDG